MSPQQGGAPKHSVKVTIMNDEFTIRSDVPPEQTREVAKYLDQSIREILTSGAVIETNRAAILAALRITAELFEERAASAAVTGTVKAMSAEVRRLLPPAKRGEPSTS